MRRLRKLRPYLIVEKAVASHGFHAVAGIMHMPCGTMAHRERNYYQSPQGKLTECTEYIVCTTCNIRIKTGISHHPPFSS